MARLRTKKGGSLPSHQTRSSAIVILALPALTVAYWLILYNIYMTVNRLTDPKGPVVQPEATVKPGFDQLKQVLQTPTW